MSRLERIHLVICVYLVPHILEKEMATHSSVLAWRIPGTEEPGGLLSMGSHGVGHDWSHLAAAAAAIPLIVHHLLFMCLLIFGTILSKSELALECYDNCDIYWIPNLLIVVSWNLCLDFRITRLIVTYGILVSSPQLAAFQNSTRAKWDNYGKNPFL